MTDDQKAAVEWLRRNAHCSKYMTTLLEMLNLPPAVSIAVMEETHGRWDGEKFE